MAADPAPPPAPAEPPDPTPSTATGDTHPEDPAARAAPAAAERKDKPWYESLKIRGYTQVRYNGFPSFDENDDLLNDQGDKYIGNGSGLGIRRARVIIFGDVHEHVAVYLQTDFASSIGDQNHVAIVRDWYADVFVDKEKTFRFRIGQSKVPYGFENLQSSQNRLPFDRNDALNSAFKDERELGVFAYWEPKEIRERYKLLVDEGLKGSGDYGVVGIGVLNGQGANRFDRNDNLHVVARVAYPFKLGGQYVEAGLGGYTGRYQVSVEEQDDGTTYTTPSNENGIRDMRAFGTLVVYPQPIGFQAEYNIGKGPSQGEDDPTFIRSRELHGGYAQAMFKIDDVFGTVAATPYVRGTLYEGGKKFETNAPRYDVKELELGVEWQIIKALEVTAAYDISERTSPRYPYNQEEGHVTRLQVQFNY
ncbi:MAG TPA: porin [Polyangiaceae bacterium]